MIKKLLYLPLILLLTSTANYANAIEPMNNKSIFSNGYPEDAHISGLQLSFEELGFTGFKLDGVNNSSSVDFTNRIDKLSTALKLNFSYTNSPSLIASVSHLKVFFNENLVTVLPITNKLSIVKNTVSHSLDLNAKYIQDYNQIRFELVGYYDLRCQDDFNRSIWTEISRSSSITLNQKQLAIDSRLEYLPAPFFDAKDYNKLNLPFIFEKAPNTEAIEAAATLSSWFGAQADWRGANFPVIYNKAPDEHSVVFMTNDSKPDFLKDYPNVTKPRVELISSPINRYKKMLLILGRDEKDLKTAVTGLVFGHKVMTGRSAGIEAINNLPLRKAYDAPRWLRDDRPVQFEELIDYPTQLQAQGQKNGPVKLNVRFAPDLFTWREKGIPVTLQYRSTPESEAIDSRLNLLINQKFITGFLLNDEDSLLKKTQTLLPLISNKKIVQSKDFSLSGINLANRNELNFDFRFGVLKKGECAVVPPGGEYGLIEGNSSIDVSEFDHYIALPDLNVFANSGFPFTKYADLQQTLVLIDEQSTPNMLNILFNLTGHFGAITGYPSHRMGVAYLDDDADLDNKDILVIAKPRSAVHGLEKDAQINILLNNNQRAIKQAIYNGAYEDKANNNKIEVSIKSSGDMAVITGFQSPFDSNRSIVSLSATTQNAFTLLNDALMNSEQLSQIKGSATVINSQGIKTIQTDEQYFVGHIPIHTLVWFHLSDHPFILALLSILTLLLISFILWKLLQTLTYKRLAEGDK
ncbi:cellulose biosynthesis cyclic di-GMP-binding regulatory protein BcsB [Pseudoalteromonas sp.]|uniref:cellulose biosynthesis cyclic di-GMP-binding regulatory protein BcsB n=1 Tax=Pseudoalteromonas sp. TaxID=53249 RepID=UPI001BCAF2D8|nr:cellulose biosynthesis cyclic di-GMP-binding regulatory protein BcsB [Pseudoalteromonas sp.]